MSDDVHYYADGAGRNLAKKFELQAYDSRSYLKEFEGKTGEEAITDGFGVLTESEEVTSAYIDFSRNVTNAMTVVHEHLDAIADALKKVSTNTEMTDEGVAVLFGKSNGGE